MSETNVSRAEPAEIRQQLAGKHVCPFCGVIRSDPNQPCPRCTMEDTPATRSSTYQRIGPWFVLQARNPSAPGMRFATLISLVKKGHVTPRSIVRGPTTQQMWTFASRVKGLSREFGLCWYCGEGIETTAETCNRCSHSQVPPSDAQAAFLDPDSPGVPELKLSASTNPETGMDGGASLDLQVDSAFGINTTPSVKTIRPGSTGPASTTPVIGVSTESRHLSSVRPTPTAEESILSAKELAAAFQLNFKPSPASRDTLLENKNLKPRLSPPPQRMGFLTTLLILSVIVIAAVAVVLGLRADLRDQAFAWAAAQWADLKSVLEAPASPVKVNSPVSFPVDSSDSRNTPAPTPRKLESPPTPIPSATPSVPPTEVTNKVDPPVPTPAVISPPPSVVSSAPTSKSDVPSTLDIDQAMSLAQQLRKNAIEAEGHDWATALKLYEQIQKLPPEAWPKDLQIRIDRAKANLKP
ncbi:MAG: hypothetical protein KatS3mg104_1683 [Phycisphaerae bacterium]|jgi:hypothetical protein|nr:MAG: hypothetical protein KatS3mg104_1683 [Phycisphaerae bacterium]